MKKFKKKIVIQNFGGSDRWGGEEGDGFFASNHFALKELSLG